VHVGDLQRDSGGPNMAVGEGLVMLRAGAATHAVHTWYGAADSWLGAVQLGSP
jgi:hypothetical protein